VVIINNGMIVADDHVENLKQTAGQKHFIHLELCNADFQDVCRGLNGIDGVVNTEQIDDTPGGSLKVRLVCESAVDLRETIYQTIKQTSWVLMGFHQETKTLENIFRELTKED
jgi:ABC-type uncharacterized transport system ATPase subunit